jgi:hypothetical protein
MSAPLQRARETLLALECHHLDLNARNNRPPSHSKTLTLVRQALREIQAAADEAHGAVAKCCGNYADCTHPCTPRGEWLAVHRKEPATLPPAAAWVVTDGGNGTECRFRTVEFGCPAWTDNIDEALQFARRRDADLFASEDEDAWSILPVSQELFERPIQGTAPQRNGALTKILWLLTLVSLLAVQIVYVHETWKSHKQNQALIEELKAQQGQPPSSPSQPFQPVPRRTLQ